MIGKRAAALAMSGAALLATCGIATSAQASTNSSQCSYSVSFYYSNTRYIQYTLTALSGYCSAYFLDVDNGQHYCSRGVSAPHGVACSTSDPAGDMELFVNGVYQEGPE